MSYWTFTDWGFEEQGVDPMPWRDGRTKFGVMTNEAVPKPVYRGMQMISQSCGEPTLPVTVSSAAGAGADADARSYFSSGSGAIGATSGAVDITASLQSGVVTALLASFNYTSGALPATTSVSITFHGLAAPLPAAATLELIDSANANPLAAWTAAGSPLYSSPAVILTELAASQLVPQALTLTPVGADAVRATVMLLPFAMARLRFSLS